MASAKKCDRCGKYYDKNELYKTSVNGCKTVIDGVAFSVKCDDITDYHDLCDDCITLLKQWLKGEN